ncbi:MAG: hypothetical protein P8L79_11605 [Rhodospirillaceae bacterium]|nr:hypothetical protein [Rhodospirillaceae bacterium]
MNRFLTIGAALLLSQVLMACTDPAIIEGCTSSDEGYIICGFERPQDLEPLLGTNGCQGIGSKPCAFPFAVVAIDPDTLAQEILYEHQDGLIPGASVALSHKGFLYMGTFFGDRISRVRLEE